MSFRARVTCASETRKMRFHGKRNFACASPNVRVETYSFWNSRRDSMSASLSPSSMRLRKRQPASFDVRVGGVGIVEAELRAEVAQGLGAPNPARARHPWE